MYKYLKKIISLLICLSCLLNFNVVNSSAEITASEIMPAQYGDEGDNVKLIQQKLYDIGYLSSKITGNYYGQTKTAISEFQKDYNLSITGDTDYETIEALNTAKYRILETGKKGEDVKRLQSRLSELGYFNAKSTGNYYSQTLEAVANFQMDNSLIATGIADIDTQEAIFNEESGIPFDIDTVEFNTDIEESSFIPFQKEIVRGTQGLIVKQVQKKLKELGFFDGPESGYFMNQTMAATEKFQEHNGLFVTGIIDEDTWNALLNNSSVLNISSPAAPSPTPRVLPYSIVVDVKNQAIKVYNNLEKVDEFTKPIRIMVCSTGMVGTASDVGEWVLNGRKAKWAYFSLYGSHARFWTQINENIAFHSVIYNSVNTMNLSKKSYYKLGSRASHGCIRLLVSDAEWIYNNIEKGTVVTITEDLPYDEELRYAIKAPPLNTEIMWPATTPVPTQEPEYSKNVMPPLPFKKLEKGSEGISVFWLQMKLQELGYYTGTVTGSYYSGTVSAVKNFQKDNDIYTDGKASVEVQQLLYDDILTKITPFVVPTPTPSLQPTTTPVPIIIDNKKPDVIQNPQG